MKSNNKIISVLKAIIFVLVGFVVALLIMYFVVSKDDDDKTHFTTYKGIDSSAKKNSKKKKVKDSETDEEEVDETSEEGGLFSGVGGESENGDVDAAVDQQINDAESSESSTESSTEAQVSSGGNDADVEQLLSKMSLHDKVCQLFIVTPEAVTGVGQVTEAGNATKSSLEQYPVGGIIYFSSNLQSVDQTKSMLSNTQNFAKEINGIPIFLAVDEEGGTVARCADKLGVTKFNDMYTYKDQGTETAYSNAATIGGYLKDLGFNLDFAPVADTWSNSANTVIGKRAYSDDFSQTADLVASAVKGFKGTGVACTIKHFPGHGDTSTDTHTSSAYTDKTSDQMMNEEYLAFKSGIAAGTDMVMVGHITASAISSEPASVSKEVVTGELRGKLGYDGVVVTDAMNMGAVADTYASSQIGVKCINAGVDIILMPSDFKACQMGLEQAVKNGEISEDRINESVRRILKLKLSMK